MTMRARYARIREFIYLGLGIALLVVAYQFFTMAVTYMSRALVATSAMSALIGFTFIVAALQLFKLSALAWSVEELRKEEGKS